MTNSNTPADDQTSIAAETEVPVHEEAVAEAVYETNQDRPIKMDEEVRYARGQTPVMQHIDDSGMMLADVKSDDFLVESEGASAGAVEASGSKEEELSTGEPKEEELSTFRFTLPVHVKNAQQDYPTNRELDGKFKINIDLAIPLPGHHIEVIDEAIINIGAEFAGSDTGREWANIAAQSRQLHPRAAGTTRNEETGRIQIPSAFMGAVSREGANYTQIVDSQKGRLGATKITSQPPTGKTTFTGDAAVNRIRSRIGMGDIVKIPLWHSGLWVSIKAPIEADLIDFLRRLSQEKINLGRSTTGAIFSNLNVVVAEYYRDFIADHIVETSYYNIDKVISRILAPDLDHIVWGLACAVYVNGFDYARSVISPVDGQKRVVRDRINLSKIQWVDLGSLSEEQKNHMGNKANGAMTEVAVNRYQEQLFTLRNRTVMIEADNGVKIDLDLKIPTLDEYIEIGNNWVNSVVQMVDRTLGTNVGTDSSERAKAISEQGMASYLQMYSHWIERIAVDNEEVYEKDAIGKLLGDMGSSEKIRKSIIKEITRFIDDSVVSLIALPALTDAEAAKYPDFPHLVPINVLHVFFILLVQKANLLPQDEVA